MKVLRVTCCLFILLLSLAAFAFEAVHSVAAQTLNPPPPAGATCQTTGQGTICQGSLASSDVNSDIGISCGSFEVLETATSTTRFTFFYDQAGDVTQVVLHGGLVGTLSNSVTGTSAPEREDATITLTFATPGDFSTITATYTGAVFKVTLPGDGIILHDVGKVVFAPDGSITFEGGPHQQLSGDTQKLCAGLS
jgi:hypothetical protein